MTNVEKIKTYRNFFYIDIIDLNILLYDLFDLILQAFYLIK